MDILIPGYKEDGWSTAAICESTTSGMNVGQNGCGRHVRLFRSDLLAQHRHDISGASTRTYWKCGCGRRHELYKSNPFDDMIEGGEPAPEVQEEF